MIHFIKEGESTHIGLNIRYWFGKWPWIAFIWTWYNSPKGEMSSYRLRIRTSTSPFIYLTSSRWNPIEGYLFDRDLYVFTREQIEDLKEAGSHAYTQEYINGILDKSVYK